jgi:obg-like ATPase 1
MPPKKKHVEEKAAIIGRMGTNLTCGIVGLPNVGKSTFFNVITKSAAPAENFPFCTIDPNESRVAVPDPRFDFLVNFFKPASKMPAYLNVTDIAGLVKGAHEGQGLGNAFLSHIKACDALFHMIRTFVSDEVTHVEGEVDPIRDLQIIHDELRLKDAEYIKRNISRLGRSEEKRANDKALKVEYEMFMKAEKLVCEEGKPIRFGQWDGLEVDELNKHMFITAKPMVYLTNLSSKDYIRKKNKWLPKIKEWIDVHDPGSAIIPFSGETELMFMDLDEEAKLAWETENKTTSALEKIILTGYKALGLMYFFTVGEDEVKAWTIQKNTKAPQAAGKIHGDFEKGFIMADIMAYEDFKAEGSENAVKAAGKYKQKGRDHIIADGDIIHFKFNAGAGLSDKKDKKK